MDNCNADNDFRLAVKHTRPKSLQEAVTAVMQEECIRMTENRNLRSKENNPIRPVYGVNEFPRNAEVPVTKKPYPAESEEKRRMAKKCYGLHGLHGEQLSEAMSSKRKLVDREMFMQAKKPVYVLSDFYENISSDEEETWDKTNTAEDDLEHLSISSCEFAELSSVDEAFVEEILCEGNIDEQQVHNEEDGDKRVRNETDVISDSPSDDYSDLSDENSPSTREALSGSTSVKSKGKTPENEGPPIPGGREESPGAERFARAKFYLPIPWVPCTDPYNDEPRHGDAPPSRVPEVCASRGGGQPPVHSAHVVGPPPAGGRSHPRGPGEGRTHRRCLPGARRAAYLAIDVLCRFVWEELPRRFALFGRLHPALLLHWRVQAHLVSRLGPDLRRDYRELWAHEIVGGHPLFAVRYVRALATPSPGSLP
uniref:Uncharacterized protein n=1 Tax=Magallana gigas TaxID=29159 RepID=K1Q6B4_MAGGI